MKTMSDVLLSNKKRLYLSAELNIFVLTILFLTCLPMVLIANSKNSSNESSTALIQLTGAYTTVLWHVLSDVEIEQDEMLKIFGYESFTDKFDERRKIRDANNKYEQYKTDIAKTPGFIVKFYNTIGDYDFDSESYPLQMYKDDQDFVVDIYNGNTKNDCVFSHGPLSRRIQFENEGRKDFNYNGSCRIWFDVNENMRSIEMNEKEAEKNQPQINEAQNFVMVELLMKPESASYDDVVRNIYFNVIGIKIYIPEIVNPWNGTVIQKKVLLKSWNANSKITGSDSKKSIKLKDIKALNSAFENYAFEGNIFMGSKTTSFIDLEGIRHKKNILNAAKIWATSDSSIPIRINDLDYQKSVMFWEQGLDKEFNRTLKMQLFIERVNNIDRIHFELNVPPGASVTKEDFVKVFDDLGQKIIEFEKDNKAGQF